MVEVIWTLVVVFSIGGGGDRSGAVAVERFGPYGSEFDCAEAAEAFEEPTLEVGPFQAGLRSYCVPLFGG